MQKKQISWAAFIVFCVGLVFAKLFLVGSEEIIARNQPLDDLWQIMASERWYWLGQGYSNNAYVHLPVYSIWIAFVRILGVPLRLATELLYISSGVVFMVMLYRLGLSKLHCIICFVAIIFHPYSFTLFNYTLAETIYCSLFIIGLAGIIMLWNSRDSSMAYIYVGVPTGVVLALLWNLRKENVLVAGLFIITIVFGLIIQMRNGDTWFLAMQRIARLFIVPIIVVFVATLTVKLLNYKKIGMFVPTEMDAPGYKAAYKALLRIRPTMPIRFVPVSREVRSMAYDVSPAFRELSEYFEGDMGHSAASETRKWMGINDEIAAGWFYWVLRDAVAFTGHYKSAVMGDAYFTKIASEINQALDAGKLPSRPVLVTFLDPDPANYLPYLPESSLKMWRLFTQSVMPAREKEDLGVALELKERFDLAANRRTSLLLPQNINIAGWVIQEKDSISKVFLKNARGEIVASCSQLNPRPDVASAYKSYWNGRVPLQSAYQLVTATDRKSLEGLQLVFVTTRGEVSVPYTQIVLGQPVELRSSTKELSLVYAIDKQHESPIKKLRFGIQGLIWQIHGHLIAYLSYLAGAAIIFVLLFRRHFVCSDSILLALLLLLAAVVSRVALFALLDASSWPGNQPRYLLPVMPLYTCFLILIIFQAGNGVATVYNGWRKHLDN